MVKQKSKNNGTPFNEIVTLIFMHLSVSFRSFDYYSILFTTNWFI